MQIFDMSDRACRHHQCCGAECVFPFVGESLFMKGATMCTSPVESTLPYWNTGAQMS